VVLTAAATGLWYLTGGQSPLPEALASRLPAPSRGADSMSTAISRGLASAVWLPIDDAGYAEALRRASVLSAPGGPGVVTLAPNELLAFLVEPFRQQLPASAVAAQVAVAEGRLYVKADVPLAELGATSMLSSLVGMVDRRDTIIVGGRFDMVEGRNAQFLIEEVVMGEFSVPKPLVPKLVNSMRRGIMPDWVAPNGYPVTLPGAIGDITIRKDRISVYRAAPATP
jgi:hypothetical protein